jgi:hypothetical protein
MVKPAIGYVCKRPKGCDPPVARCSRTSCSRLYASPAVALRPSDLHTVRSKSKRAMDRAGNPVMRPVFSVKRARTKLPPAESPSKMMFFIGSRRPWPEVVEQGRKKWVRKLVGYVFGESILCREYAHSARENLVQCSPGDREDSGLSCRRLNIRASVQRVDNLLSRLVKALHLRLCSFCSSSMRGITIAAFSAVLISSFNNRDRARPRMSHRDPQPRSSDRRRTATSLS